MPAIYAAAGIAFDLQRYDADSTDAIVKKLISCQMAESEK